MGKSSHINILDKMLKQNKLINESETKKQVVKETPKQGLKETQLLHAELDTLVENSIKECLQNVIQESAQADTLKLKSLNAVSDLKLSEADSASFMEDTIDPLIEMTAISSRVMDKNTKPIKAVSIPVYEVAMTLASAQMGALNLESLSDSPVSDSVGPIMDDLSDGEATAVEDDAQKMSDVVDGGVDQTYNFGKLEETAVDIYDVDQFEDNDNQNIDQNKFESPMADADTEYEGDEAGGQGDADFDTVLEGSVISKLFSNIVENTIDDYEGEEAGVPNKDEIADNEFEADGTADEAISEHQILIAKQLIGRIFLEWNILDKDVQKNIVLEAMRSIFKYGATNLVPSVSDAANLVVEQNDLYSRMEATQSSAKIIENTKPILTDAQKQSLKEQANELKNALLNTHMSLSEAAEDTKKQSVKSKYTKAMLESQLVKEAVATITKANLIERTRQAFRFRMNKFAPEAKAKVSSQWGVIDNNLSEAAQSLRSELTIRRFVTEGKEIKEFMEVLKEDSPIWKSSIKRVDNKRDNLVAAAIVCEMAITWAFIKRKSYNQQPMPVKKAALDIMFESTDIFARMTDQMKNPKIATNVIDNFKYRLQSLRDKVESKM